ncbi:CENPX protein, partial [Alopecoenas beccarii]|nr:CENPX protein [Alopecoenas beccarii]
TAAHPLFFPAQDTVDRLLRWHFRDRRTRGTGAAGGPGWAASLPERFVVAVNGDALLLMAEMLKVFVRGEHGAPGPRVSLSRDRVSLSRDGAQGSPRAPSRAPTLAHGCSAEAAARAARQAQAEELRTVDIEHVEKVLPQLVRPG